MAVRPQIFSLGEFDGPFMARCLRHDLVLDLVTTWVQIVICLVDDMGLEVECPSPEMNRFEVLVINGYGPFSRAVDGHASDVEPGPE